MSGSRRSTAIRLLVPRTESFQLTIRWLADDGVAVKAGDRVVEFDNAAVTAQLETKRLGLAVIAAPGGAARPARMRMASGELRGIALGACDAQGCAVVSGVSDGDAVVLGGGP